MAQSATLNNSDFANGVLWGFTAPFRAIGSFLVSLAENGPRMQAVRRLNETSDEELAARGLTREGEVRRIFGPAMY
ncbi:DUF1127 domain-containing protein [Paracoccus fistulariae]|uniref:DUF1127 domain-containing protein n=1 Tax=Paracoccus fistulariae TaxID=658446 RepID=A0ABY7SG32_9RHOB|nr:DUF1127 domain-containing protein [Paracoccus fistulariae]MDB6181733.1 DUF1127 domain-containing protein [Paracoccus fistulariae]WCR05969.1 DUF1127 domain-containing protein [Paracoccus fistulariae]